MSSFDFTCTGVRADPYAAGPTLVFRLRVTAPGDQPVHAMALRCQIRIEPALRRYDDHEGAALGDLFGDRSRWGTTLNPLQFAQVSLVCPGFTGETEVDVPVPCTYDMDIAATKYFEALREGTAPLLMLFSGIAFRGPGGFQVEPIPWDKEAPVRMPVAVWREMMEQHFPGCGWIRLPRDTMAALQAFRSRRALPSWQQTVEVLLDAARSDEPDPAGAAAHAVPPVPSAVPAAGPPAGPPAVPPAGPAVEVAAP